MEGGVPQRESLEQRLKRRVIGVRGPLDEASEAEVNRVLAGLASWSFYLTTVLMTISLGMDVHRAGEIDVTFGSVALLILQQFAAWYLIIRMRKSRVHDVRTESETDYRQEIVRAKRSAAWAGLCWGVFMMATMNWLLPFIAGLPINTDIVHHLIWLVGGVLFGWILYAVQKRRIVRNLDTRGG